MYDDINLVCSYDIDSIVSEMDQNDYQIVSNYEETSYVYKLENNNIVKTYDNIYGVRFGYLISFSSLYKLLKVEGYNVIGNSHNYKVYYYILNGEKQKFNFKWYRFFNSTDIKKMFNLKVKCIENRHINNYNFVN